MLGNNSGHRDDIVTEYKKRCRIQFGGPNCLIFSFLCSGNKIKYGVEFRHSIRYVLKIFRKVNNRVS